MRNLILFLSVALLSIPAFADHSANIKNLGSVWKSLPAVTAKNDKTDLAIVYGGEDISSKPTIDPRTTNA